MGLAASAFVPSAVAQGGLSNIQGAWLSGGADCAEVYSSNGKGVSFKKPVDIFAPAFIIVGNRLRTPQATCQIKSAKPSGSRHLLLLNCSNAVSGSEVRILMAREADGSLRRYFNEEDSIGTEYKHCSK
nr:hypothetical protein [Microvirga solisilvae]